VARYEASGVEPREAPQAAPSPLTTVGGAPKHHQQENDAADLLLSILDITEWEEYNLDPQVLRPYLGSCRLEELQELLAIIAYNARVSRGKPKAIANPIGLLIANLQGRTRINPLPGYKSLARRRLEQEQKEAEELAAIQERTGLLRFQTALSEGTRRWVNDEVRRRVLERPGFKIPEHAVAGALLAEEEKVMKELYALHKAGRPLPGT